MSREAHRTARTSLQAVSQGLTAYDKGDLMHQRFGLASGGSFGAKLGQLRSQARVIGDMDIGWKR